MSGPSIEYCILAALTLKSLIDGSTLTLNATTKPIDSGLPTTAYYPILQSTGDLGAQMGNYLPDPFSSTIVLDDAFGCLGYQRKLSDLFERYTPVAQSVVIKIATAEPGLLAASDFAQEWSGLMTDWKRSGDSVHIQISTQQIPNRNLTKVVTTSDFPSAPQASLGQALPIVVGSGVQVKPVRIDADADTSPAYAYATTLATTFPVGGVSQYYAKDKDSTYQPVQSVANLTDAAYGNAYVAGKSTGSFSGMICAKPFTTGSSSYIITQIVHRYYKNSAATFSGQFRIQIRDSSRNQNVAPTAAPGKIIAEATYDLASFTTTTGELDISVTFPEPLVLKSNTLYYYVFWIDSDDITTKNSSHIYYDGAVAETGYKVLFNSAYSPDSGQWYASTLAPPSGVGYKVFWRMLGVKLTDTKSAPADSDGFGYASVELTQNSAPTGFTNPDLTKLDLIFQVDGLKDNVGGSISGTGSLLLESPQQIIELLFREWNGSDWATISPYAERYSHTHDIVNDSTNIHFRKVAGKTTGIATLRQVLEAICMNSLCLIGVDASDSTPLGAWFWGDTEASVATITDEECSLVEFSELTTATVVNDLEMYFDNRLTQVDFVTGSDQGKFKSYAQSLRMNDLSSSEVSQLSGLSRTMFGVRKNSNPNFDFLNHAASASVVGRALLAIYRNPHRYVDYDVPYHLFSDVKLLNAVTIVDPQLPAFYGTTPNANLATYAGESVDAGRGNYLKRAACYRGFVTSRKVIFNGSIPRIRLGIRLLVNPYDPT